MTDSERGQAAVETLLLTFVIITFVAAAYQIFLVNQAIFLSITAVHQELFEQGFARNCADPQPECEYSQDPEFERLPGPRANIVWSPSEIPEVSIPVVGIFGEHGLDADIRLSSNRAGGSGGGCTGLPCKRTRMGAGTYKSVPDGIWFLRKVRPDADSLRGYAEWIAGFGILSAIAN